MEQEDNIETPTDSRGRKVLLRYGKIFVSRVNSFRKSVSFLTKDFGGRISARLSQQ